MPRRRASPLLLVALLLLAGGALWGLDRAATSGAALGGPWTLLRADGRVVSDRDFRGRFLLVYLGYTACPDLCPTALGTMEAALQVLGARAGRVQPLFISIDPGHDTPAVLGRYVAAFGPDLVGLTGTEAQVRAVQREYHVRSALRPWPGREDAVIDHTSVLFLVGPDGRVLAPLAADATPGQLAGQLGRFLP